MKLSDISDESPKSLKLSDIDPDVPVPSVQLRQMEAGAKVKDIPKSRKEIGLEELSTATGMGAAAGAAMPEILKFGGKAAAATGLPFLSGIGRFAEAMSPYIGGSKITRGLSGGIGGGVSEAAGQTYEFFSEPGLGAEATRFAVGNIPLSAGTSFLTGKAGQVINRLAKSLGKAETNLPFFSNEIKTQRQAAINALGKPATVENFENLLNGIKVGAENDIGLLNLKAAKIATDAEDFAKSLIQQSEREAAGIRATGKAAGEEITGTAQKTASNLAAQYEQRLSAFKQSAENDARKVLDESKVTAQNIRNAAAGKAKDQREKMYAAANEIERNTQSQVQEFLKTSNDEVVRLRSLLSKTRKRAEVSRGYVREAAEKIGQPVTETEIGQAARAPAESQFNQFKKIRENQIKGAEDEIFQTAKNLEAQGVGYQSTKAYQNAIRDLNALLINPETKRASITVPQLETQINNVLKSLKGKEKLATNEKGEQIVTVIPGDFRSLEYLRRFLGDRASGVPAEGFDAIGQDMAKTLKQMVQNIQDEFVAKGGQSKPWTAYLEKYREASIPLNQYKSDLGQSLLGKQEWDASKYVADAADIAKGIFKSHGAVESYRALSGASNEELQTLGKQFLSNEIFNKGKSAGALLKEHNDWLSFPPFNDLKNTLSTIERTEKLSGETAPKLFAGVQERARKGLREALQTEPGVLDIAKKGAKERASAIEAGRKKVTPIIEAGKKESQKAIEESGKEAKRILGTVPKEERKLASELRSEQKQIGKEAAIKKGEAIKSAETEAKTVISKAKEAASNAIQQAAEQLRIPSGQAKELQSALDSLGDTPANAFEKIVFGADPVGKLKVFSQYIKNTPQGLDDFEKGVIEGLIDRAKKNPATLVREWETTVKPAIVDAGLMSSSSANNISNQLRGIQSLSQGDVRRLTFAENMFKTAVRQAISQAPGLVYRRIGE
jgi:hypothetical protein